MFRRLSDVNGPDVEIILDGNPIKAREGESVAAALLASGYHSFRRSPVGGEPRGPYCMMGVCFDCLLTIDGVRNRQACLVSVSNGMTVETRIKAHGAPA